MIASLKELINKTWKIYKNNFAKVSVIILAVWIPLVLIQAILIEPSLDLESVNEILQNQELVGTPEYEDAAIVMMRSMSIYMIMSLIISFLGILSDIAITKLADESHGNGLKKVKTSFGDIFSDSVPLIPRCIWIVILTGLFVSVGLMMFILPGIYIYVMSSLAVTAAVLAGVKGMTSIRVSFTTVKNEIFTVALGMLIFIAISAVISFAADLVSIPLPDNKIITAALNSLVIIIGKFVTAAQFIFFTVFFTERYKKISSEHGQDKVPAEVQ